MSIAGGGKDWASHPSGASRVSPTPPCIEACQGNGFIRVPTKDGTRAESPPTKTDLCLHLPGTYFHIMILGEPAGWFFKISKD